MEFLAQLIGQAAHAKMARLPPRMQGDRRQTPCHDLLVFTDGSVASIRTLARSRTTIAYPGWSWMQRKQGFFCSGLTEIHIQELLEFLGFKLGLLPVKYLGVPLTSTGLKAADCDNLTWCITARIKTWTSESLSYAGRLKLISSVLHSMTNYRFWHFIIPKKAIEQAQQVCSSFQMPLKRSLLP